MFKRLFPRPLLTLTLGIIWLLLNNSAGAGHVLLGIVLGWSIPFFTLPFWPDEVTIHRPTQLLRFSGVVLYDIVVSNFIVARLILGSPNALSPRFIRVPLAIKSDIAISLLANIISLTPGTVSSLLTKDRSHLIVHALDCDDAQALVDEIKSRYEAPLKEIFEHGE